MKTQINQIKPIAVQKDICGIFILNSIMLLQMKNVSEGIGLRDPQICPSTHTQSMLALRMHTRTRTSTHTHVRTQSLLPSVWALEDSAADQTNKKSLFVT